jgi:hypothetical protein
MENKIKLNRLVESFHYGFGRIVEIGYNFFTVKWSYLNKEISYKMDEITGIKFYNDSEDSYL